MGEGDLTTEQALLRATGEALAAHGIGGLTTQRVADEWGKSQSLVHYYYETKTDLVVAYIEHLRERYRERYDAAADDPPLARLRSLLHVAGGHEDSRQSFSRVQLELHAAAAHEDRYREALNRLEDDARQFAREVLHDGIEAGTFRDVDIEATVTLLLSAHDGGMVRVGPLDRTQDAASLEAGLETYLASVLLADGDDGAGADTGEEAS